MGLRWKVANTATISPPRARRVSTSSPETIANGTWPLATSCAHGTCAPPLRISTANPSATYKPSCRAANNPPNSGSGTQFNCNVIGVSAVVLAVLGPPALGAPPLGAARSQPNITPTAATVNKKACLTFFILIAPKNSLLMRAIEKQVAILGNSLRQRVQIQQLQKVQSLQRPDPCEPRALPS